MEHEKLNAQSAPELLVPELKTGLVESLTEAYAMLLKRQRTASSAYVRWITAHSRAHEFAWIDAPAEPLLLNSGTFKVEPESSIFASIQRMKATIELNPYERELQYGYPYIVGYVDGEAIRAPILTIPIQIEPSGKGLRISVSGDSLRFNSLPFRAETDPAYRELALAHLIEGCPELPLSIDSLRNFCNALSRDLGVKDSALLDGSLKQPPAQPRQSMELTMVDCAACFIASKTSYFLVSDLETIGKIGASSVANTSLGWLLGRRPPESISDRFEDRTKLFFPFSSNQSQRRVAHLLDDPKSRIIVVQGPPGTGKSLTIANVACHLIATGKKVLISSQKDKALEVVDDLLKELGLAELPMTLMRQDRESKKQLQERLESIQKELSSEEAKLAFETERNLYKTFVEEMEKYEADLVTAIRAEHHVERADNAVRSATKTIRRLSARWKLMRTLRRANRESRIRSDELGRAVSEKRKGLRNRAVAILRKAAVQRTCSAQKAERNQLRELAKLLSRNQTNAKNFPIFDRMKNEPIRCSMLLNVLPCWIMSPDDVARLFPCQAGLFDVVIVDEASQCDLPSMTPVLYRAKQVVVAGDSKQMQAQRYAFTSSQVSAQAWTQHGLEKLDPDKWLDPAKIDLLQLASVRLDEEVFLDEHYRSVPPIISFSNSRWYGNRLRLMRDSDDRRNGDPSEPAIKLHRLAGRVKNGTQENEIEARALVQHLLKLMNHPAYSEATFGVICLFEEQMRLLSELVLEMIPEELCLEHELVVVNPDGFQGDERDVILYSLSYDAHGMSKESLSARQADRPHIQGMLNVAFTRARDEVHVFHSADIQDFGMADGTGAIKDWLRHCNLQQSNGSIASGSLEAKLTMAQSEFEQQVITELHNRGIATRPQFPSCGYFIDVVAEHGDNRIAIECDGENWHLDEHGNMRSEDLARQEVLERAGWHVVRVPYRSWREDSESQVQRLMNLLQGVKEDMEETQENQRSDTDETKGLALEKHQWAIIHALKGGSHSLYEVCRDAREAMGFSRMGPKIKKNLDKALEELSKAQIIKVEEGEVYFQDEAARNREYSIDEYAIDLNVLFPRARPKSRRYRRYRRW
jgi:very-short-patch-repair endonuclease